MTERNRPYIGVSGVVSPDQHRELVAIAEPFIQNRATHSLAVGIKATHKPQYDDIENKYGRLWYPVGDAIAGVTDAALASQTFNIAQVYLEPQNIADDPLYPERFFDKLCGRTRHYLDALQVDMLPYHTDPEQFTGVCRAMARTGLVTILQCHGFAMAHGPAQALEDLKAVTNIAEGSGPDYVLFDASHGRGQVMNPGRLLPFLSLAYEDSWFADFGTNFGIAGGLSSETVDSLLAPIVAEFPQVSWDAEGKPHKAIQDGGNGSLHMQTVRNYLVRSYGLLEKGR